MRRILLLCSCLLYLQFAAQQLQRETDSLVHLIDTTKNMETKLVRMASLAQKHFQGGDQKKALRLLAYAAKEGRRIGSDMALGEIFHRRGNIYYFQSIFDSALASFEKALVYRRKAGDSPGIIKTSSNIGGIYSMLQKNQKALQYYEEALRREAELGYPEGTYVQINNVGTIYHILQKHDKAIEYLRKAQRLYAGKPADLIYVYSELSLTFKDMKKMDSAYHYNALSIKEGEAAGDERSTAISIMERATLFMHDKKYRAADSLLRKALAISSKHEDKRAMWGIYGNLAASQIERNQMDSALVYLDLVAKLQKDLNVKTNRQDQAQLFAEYYFRKKEYQKAFESLKLFDKYKDSLYDAENTAQMQEMLTRFETEKKEKQNQLLQSENKRHKTTRDYLIVILIIAFIALVGGMIAINKIRKAKKEILAQKALIEEKQKEILDSIHYARRIQYALLAGEQLLNQHLPEYFVLFRPKDVVSGDFYWAAATDEGFVYLTGDCTGHGVPGAFMSLLNISKLNEAVNEKNISRPDLTLNYVRTEIIKALNPKGSTVESKDGMDAVLCRLNLKEMKLEFAAANNSFYILRKNELIHCKADKMPVGKTFENATPFTYNEISLEKGDIIYTFTDGLADQFGGDKGKKFKYKQLETFLKSVAHEPMEMQKEKLNKVFQDWKGKLEQVDDICVIGVRV
jgi:serine phosphatase RsbU (regulator of sigma subunit)/tetratricopeptide (TPR) repeat protein